MVWVVALMALFPLLVCGLNAGLNRRTGAHPHVTPFRSGGMALIVLLCATLPFSLFFWIFLYWASSRALHSWRCMADAWSSSTGLFSLSAMLPCTFEFRW